jgi:predicted GH43/DUF377 family glycosyl hydrolase
MLIMKELATRFAQNPLLSPSSFPTANEHVEIACLLNPGAFRFNNKIWLIIRVAERPRQKENMISFHFLNNGETQLTELLANDPDLVSTDPRVIRYKNEDYLTTLSHLRLVCSDDGINFEEPLGYPHLYGEGPLENFGIEDCRVSFLGNTYYLTYTAVSGSGVGVGLRTTTDWKNFVHYGMILPPHNKDCAIFEEKINGKFYALHRPSSPSIGGNFIWLAESPDGIHWGNHKCIVKTRKDRWDNVRVGAGAAPIKTAQGWLEIYHGANEQHQYCLGAFLMDLQDPSKIISRTKEPIMVPREDYELKGFFGNVVFSNGHITEPDGDTITVYYGAADEFICGAQFSLKEILAALDKV